MSYSKTNPYFTVFYLIVFFSSNTSEAYPNLLISQVEINENPLATCILKIIQKHVPCNKFISIVISGNECDSDVIKTINDDACYSVTLKSSHENHQSIWTETYVVLTMTADDLSGIISQLSNNLHWNPTARFIIQTNETSHDKIEYMFEILLTWHIYNVVVLHLIDDEVLVHTYFPFGDGRCGRHFEHVISLGVCSNAVISSVPVTNNLISDNMKNCTVNVMFHEEIPAVILESSNYTIFGKYEPGLEQYMLENIGHYLDFTYTYKILSSTDYIGSVLPNRSVTGMFVHLQDGLVDIAGGGLILTRYRADVYDYIWGYNYERISLFTPVIDSKLWKNIFKELGPSSWLLTLLCYCLVSGISILIVTLYSDIAQERLLLIFKLWGFFFQGNTDKSLLKVKRLRLLLSCWIWFTFFITNFYNTAMFSMVTSQAGHKGFFNVDDLDHLPFRPCISENMRSLFLSAYNQRLPNNVPLPNCKYAASSLTEVATRTDLYTLGIKQTYKLRAYEFTNMRGQSTIDAWDYSNACIPVLYVKKGYPLKEKIDKFASYMYEAGLIKKQFDYLCLRSHSAVMRKSKTFVRVRLEYLKIHFFVLGVGILVSFVVFLLELIVKRFGEKPLLSKQPGI